MSYQLLPIDLCIQIGIFLAAVMGFFWLKMWHEEVKEKARESIYPRVSQPVDNETIQRAA
ncbi:hypothetical protein GF406_19735 [candidate division KSB1 bacterium]|nr:hypothetical protein [candidate division KSB1 bacterium]